jgi:cobaltochelatase CobS
VDLNLISLDKLNAVLINFGRVPEIDKTQAVNLVSGLLRNKTITEQDIRNATVTAAVTAATSGADSAQIAQIASETAAALAKSQTARSQVDAAIGAMYGLVNQVNNDFARLNADLDKKVAGIQGIDYSKVNDTLRSEVAALFDQFKRVATPEQLSQVAAAVPATRKAKASDVFPVTKYKAAERMIDFGDVDVDLWDDPAAPMVLDDYYFNPAHLHLSLIALKHSLPYNQWLAGERGTGKTEYVTQLAARLGRKLFRVNFDAQMERAEFIGATSIENGTAFWKAGVIAEAIQHAGALILLDELSFADPSNLAVFHSLAERSPHRALMVAETGQRIPVASHVCFFAADNSTGFGDQSGNFAGLRDQNSAFIDRFPYTLEFNYLPAAEEIDLIVKRTGIDSNAAQVIVTFANVARGKARAGVLTQPPSLRQLFAWANAISDGFPVDLAFNRAIVNKFPPDCAVELQGVYAATINEADLQSFLVRT